MCKNVYCFLEVLMCDCIFKVKRGIWEIFREMVVRDFWKIFFLILLVYIFK